MTHEPLASRANLIFLRPAAIPAELAVACTEARDHSFRALSVSSSWTRQARELLEGSEVLTSCVIGFPWGANDSDVKRYETEVAVDLDAHELEVVLNLSWIKEGAWGFVERELRDIVEAADERPVWAVVEPFLFTNDIIARAALVARDAGAHGIQISTGLVNAGIALEDTRLLRELLGEKAPLKIAGGIRGGQIARAYLAGGATHLAASSAAALAEPTITSSESNN